MQELIESAVTDFGKTMGLEKLEFTASRTMQFSFESIGEFFIELLDVGAVFYLVREIPDYDMDKKINMALKLCGNKESRRFDTQCGLKDSNQLVTLVFLTAQQTTVPEVEAVLNHLVKFQEKTDV